MGLLMISRNLMNKNILKLCDMQKLLERAGTGSPRIVKQYYRLWSTLNAHCVLLSGGECRSCISRLSKYQL